MKKINVTNLYRLSSPYLGESNSHTSRHEVSKARFILRYILKFFFPRTRELCPVHERIIRSIRYDKGQINVIFRSFGFAEWFVGPKRYPKFAPKSF